MSNFLYPSGNGYGCVDVVALRDWLTRKGWAVTETEARKGGSVIFISGNHVRGKGEAAIELLEELSRPVDDMERQLLSRAYKRLRDYGDKLKRGDNGT